MWHIFITCMCKSHLHLVSFLFVPAIYYPLNLHAIIIPLLIISSVYVRDGAVCGIYITKHIIIDVHHWNSTFQLTASVYTFI